ncbi:N-acetyl-gamma-glutamyl-phosphate reductase [Austwickia sp. TVS 96-490-7B]|nr:N-acetyl-gamma-glutamyl-phosphate reductase [Austwickia sp. TVS 96-490-7B]
MLRLLIGHPTVHIGALTAASNAGSTVGDHHSHLFPLADRKIQETTVEALADHDAVVLALPHGTSAGVAAQLPPHTIVVDCGADFRLRDASAWARFYDTPYAGSWPYGLPELLRDDGSRQRQHLLGATRIAAPGCYPTVVSLALAPGLQAGLIQPHDVVVVAASGTSGAGRSLRAPLMASTVMGSMSSYSVAGVHRHIPEIEQNLSAAAGESVQVSFTPLLAPMSRGILATCTARLRGAVTPEQVRSTWVETYADEPYVRVLPAGRWPTTGDVLGSNVVAMQVAVDVDAERVIVVAAVDNLTKGTGGAVVQCLNLALGLPETAGLPMTGVAP